MKCVGCGRCELACTEFNDGKAAPTLSRIKVDRNLNFGPEDVFGWRRGTGQLGGRAGRAGPLQAVPAPCTLCRRLSGRCHCGGASGQCAGGRPGKVHGLQDLPEGMPLGDDLLRPGFPQGDQVPPLQRKTEVCGGLPGRVAQLRALARPDEQGTPSYCDHGCHSTERGPWPARNATCPARRRLLGGVSGMFWEAVKGGKGFSVREFGFKWIDLVGMVLLPLVLVS